MSYTLALVAVGTLLILIYAMLAVRETWDLREDSERILHLKRAKDRALRKLKDIEVEHEEGSLLGEDYEKLREQAKHEAIQVTKELNKVRSATIKRIVNRDSPQLSAEETQAIEKLVEQYKKNQ